MNVYSITYDLVSPGKNYDSLIDRLNQIGAVKVQFSHWLLKGQRSAKEVRDDLMRYIDANDRLLVAGLSGEAAWTNLLASDDTVKKTLTR